MKLLLLVLVLTTSAFAATEEELMKKWQSYATPSAAHQILKKMVGHWTYTSKFWEKADAKPTESKGTSTMKLILGGRFLQQDTKGRAMGQPFEGIGFTGFDNVKGKYDTIWLDNMSTGVMHGTGDYELATTTLKDSGEFTCPIAKEKTREYRSEWKLVDADHMIYAMWAAGPEGGAEFKQMELTFKRVKK